MSNAQLTEWTHLAAVARGEGPTLTAGIVDAASLYPTDARRGIARAAVSVAADRQVWTSFDAGSSHADVRDGRVNIDGELVSPPETQELDQLPLALAKVDAEAIAAAEEVLAGVAAHEGAHQRYTEPHREPNSLLRFLVNLIEDERIERLLAGDMPVFAGPLSTAREHLITAEGIRGIFAAVYLLLRMPERLPLHMWRRHQKILLGVIEILTPFPQTHADVRRAADQIAALLPPGLEESAPRFPEFGESLQQKGKRPRRGHFSRWGRGSDEITEPDPKVHWIDPPAAAAGYLEYKATTEALANAVHAAIQPPERPHPVPSIRGKTDRRNLWRHPFSDRVFRRTIPTQDRLDVVLILDLSGSMRGTRWNSQMRLGVSFFEAALQNPLVRLLVYGHGADAEDRPSTQIYRLADSTVHHSGTSTCLGDLPEGANNRDGHSLRLIGQDLLDNHPKPRGRRLVFHACDGSPSAAGYGGQPALGSTREALSWFAATVAPIGQIGIEPEEDLTLFGAPCVVWEEEHAERQLKQLIRAMKGSA